MLNYFNLADLNPQLSEQTALHMLKDTVSQMFYCIEMKMTTAAPSKPTKVVLPVEEKLVIIELLWKDTFYTTTARKYGIA